MTTLIHEGIEFILPGIYKAYPREWAEQLIHEGTLYFTALESFQRDEHPERGDSLEGTAIVIREGQRCTIGSLNPIFVCCFTMETDRECILTTWNDRDTVVQICNTLKFAERILDYVETNEMLLRIQVGPVAYDKDEGSYREPFRGESTFQKNLRFSGQKEFRFALVGFTNMRSKYEEFLANGEHLILKLGDCSDIMRIVE